MERIGRRLGLALAAALLVALALHQALGRFGAWDPSTQSAAATAGAGAEPPPALPALPDSVPAGAPWVVYLVPLGQRDKLPKRAAPVVEVHPDGRVELLVAAPVPERPDVTQERWLAAAVLLPVTPQALFPVERAALLEVLRRWQVGRSREGTPLFRPGHLEEWPDADRLRRWMR